MRTQPLYPLRSYRLRLTALALAALATSVLSAMVTAPARAADLDMQTAVVPYGDLDLRTPAGAATLEDRIARAVEQVCGPADHRFLVNIARSTACRNAAITDAGPRVMTALAATGRARQYASKDAAAPASPAL